MKEPQPYGGFKCCTVLLHSALSMPKPIISKKDLDKGRRNRGEINCQHTLCFQISCHFLLMSKIHVRQVGSEVARRGIGLGFERVIAYDPYASEVKAQALGVKLVSWEEALAQGDFFSLHMPMTPQTKARFSLLPAPCLPKVLWLQLVEILVNCWRQHPSPAWLLTWTRSRQ